MTNQEKAYLKTVAARLEDMYRHPIVAPNGKLEGMCLIIRGLRGMVKRG